MKMTISVEVPDEVAASRHAAGLEEHMRLRAEQARDEFLQNEVSPQGCWCSGLDHNQKCRHWVLPY
jgi:hypothetical protein